MKTADRDAFIAANIGLVHACARRFMDRGAEYDDLFQAGCVGLIKACDAFDDARGVRFSTYAVPVILGEIKKIFRDGGTVKVSRQLKELSLKINVQTQMFSAKEGREPTLDELAEKLGCSPALITEAVCACRMPMSLTSEDDDEEGRSVDLPTESGEEKLTELISLGDSLKKLTEDERGLLKLRFLQNKTQSECAGLLGTTQVQISRREKRILEKLRGLMAE